MGTSFTTEANPAAAEIDGAIGMRKRLGPGCSSTRPNRASASSLWVSSVQARLDSRSLPERGPRLGPPKRNGRLPPRRVLLTTTSSSMPAGTISPSTGLATAKLGFLDNSQSPSTTPCHEAGRSPPWMPWYGMASPSLYLHIPYTIIPWPGSGGGNWHVGKRKQPRRPRCRNSSAHIYSPSSECGTRSFGSSLQPDPPDSARVRLSRPREQRQTP